MKYIALCRQLCTSALLASSLLAAFVLLPAGICLAAQAGNDFSVVVRLNRPISESAFCRSNSRPGSFGATVTVVCKTGAVVDIEDLGSGSPWKPTHGGAYKFITQFSVAGDYQRTISHDGLGTVTSWRTVNLQDRDYLELLIGW